MKMRQGWIVGSLLLVAAIVYLLIPKFFPHGLQVCPLRICCIHCPITNGQPQLSAVA